MLPGLWEFIAGGAVGAVASWWVHGHLWWIVMHKAWVHGHEARRRKRLRRLKSGRRNWRGVWR